MVENVLNPSKLGWIASVSLAQLLHWPRCGYRGRGSWLLLQLMRSECFSILLSWSWGVKWGHLIMNDYPNSGWIVLVQYKQSIIHLYEHFEGCSIAIITLGQEMNQMMPQWSFRKQKTKSDLQKQNDTVLIINDSEQMIYNCNFGTMPPLF